ncbi:MAG: tetratricopeptide repeat protein [Geobacteraceae bacterium]|nr:tetratricopeptide repeat protein [Geobacteraceae bacterium]
MEKPSRIHFNWHSHLWKSLSLLAAVTMLVYAVTLFNGFVLDDEDIIVNNPQTLNLSNIPEVLLAPDLIKPYYRPLNRASYLLDYHLAGLNPSWYHGVNIIIHLGNVILLYLLCRRFLADKNAALMAALLFAVHPANTEAVNFISARNTLLALFFSLSSLLAFVDARIDNLRRPMMPAFLFFCALLSKETGLMLIVVIAVYCLIPLPGELREHRPWRERLSVLAPFLLATLVYFALRTYSLHGGTELSDAPAAPLYSRLAQNYHIIPQYLGLLLFPADLNIFHRVPANGGLFQPSWYLPAWLVMLAMAAMIIRSRNRAALFGLLWLIINYAPISNVIPIPSGLISERFLYLPSAGFFIIFGVFIAWLTSWRLSRNLVLGGVAVIAAVCAAVTVQRNLDWKNNLSLFSSGARNDPLSPVVHYYLGTAYKDSGDMVAAGKEWEKALSLNPGYAEALAQLGTMAAIQGNLQKAEQHYIAALEAPSGVSAPDISMAHYNLGKIYEKKGQPQRAMKHYQQFLKDVPFTYQEYQADAERRLAFLLRTFNAVSVK